ncbi:MAG: ParB N-terminal domain-containing protein [Candidatus Shapirobacteria bacterium]|nr:ParB N-terminal domain-containing protein [Candidatus Shapirobacteria bacterium]
MLNWKTEKRKISDLLPTVHNPRQLTEKQVKDLKTSIEKFNLVEIPVINLDNTILAGHQRLKIMSMLGRGEEEIDVRVPDRQLTKEEADEYLIRSNKNTGEWNFDELANSFDQKDLLDWGFEEWELGMSFNPDEVEPSLEGPTNTDGSLSTTLVFDTMEELKRVQELCSEGKKRTSWNLIKENMSSLMND